MALIRNRTLDTKNTAPEKYEIKSVVDFKGIGENISLRNVLYFLLMLPITFYYDVGFWVIELADICVGGIIIIWLFRKKNRKKEQKIIRSFKTHIKVFLIFNYWAFITIGIAGATKVSMLVMVLMVAKALKLVLYTFIVIVFLHEVVSKTEGYRYLLLGLIVSLMLHFPNQIYSTRTADARELKVMEQRERLATGEDLGAKNSNANLAACFLLMVITMLSKRTLLSGMVVIMALFLMVLYSASRGAWIAFAIGLLFISYIWIIHSLRGKRVKNKEKRSRYKIILNITIIFLIGVVLFGLRSQYIRKNLFESTYEDPFSRGEKTYTGGRLTLAKKAIQEMIKPIDYLVGKGYYSRFYRDDMWPFGAHNQYIQYIWETGLIGLFLFLLVFKQFINSGSKIRDKKIKYSYFVIITIVLFTGNSEIFFYGPTFIMGQFILLTYLNLFYCPEIIETAILKKNINGGAG